MRLVKFTVFLTVLLGSTAFAAAPTLMNFQGLLTDTSGVPLADSNYVVAFRIYDNSIAGNLIWEETRVVPTTDGLFEVLLGGIDDLEHFVFYSSNRYLGIQVGANPEMFPRTQLVSVPYALRTGTVDGAAGGYISSSVAIGSGNVFNGNYVFVAGQGNNVAANNSTIAGGSGNSVTGNATLSTIGGGSQNIAGGNYAFVGGGESNNAVTLASFVGGGTANVAGAGFNSYAAVVGGIGNDATGDRSFVGGGDDNLASGTVSTVPGGQSNTASGVVSFAAGYRAKAIHSGTFVWGDNTASNVSSSATNQFTARVRGGARFFTDSALTTGVQLASGGGAWSAVSDVNVKENIEPVDGREILDKLSDMPISSWNYITQDDDIRHIGPMAQDFDNAFGFGEDNRLINSIDADGIALAAAQQLAKENAELKARVEKLEQILAKLIKGEL